MSLTPAPVPAAPSPSLREALPATLRRAAAGSQTPFTTLVGIAAAESNFQPDARNARSSAAGLFQITERTWLELVKRYAAGAGRADLAGMVTADAEGLAVVAPEHRRAVLEARQDPDLTARLTAKLCDENRAGLARKLGRAPSESEVRLAHFLGLGGATKLIQAAADTPDASIKALLPKAFAHNRATLSEGGKPMTAAQAVALLDGRYAREVVPAPRPASPPPVPATLVAQLADIAPAAGPRVAEAEPPPPEPKPIVVADAAPKALACETNATGIRCAL